MWPKLLQNPGKDLSDHWGTLCPRNDATWPPWMSSCSTAIPMWYQHQRILLMPILSSMSAQICCQPSPNAQWQKPHCEDPTLFLIGQPDGQLSSRRGPDISVSNQISPSESFFMGVCPCVCVCACGRERERVHSAKWLLGAYVLTAARVCVEMKINE